MRLHSRAGGSASVLEASLPCVSTAHASRASHPIPLVTRPMGGDNRPTMCGGVGMDGELQAHSGTIILENEDHRAGRAQVSFSARICTVCVHVCESL